MVNTTLSCTPPIVQLAGTAALRNDRAERNEVMTKFRDKVVLLTEGLNKIDGFHSLPPTAPDAVTFSGGIPVMVNGEFAGAIGVSGSTQENDVVAAQAGLAAMGM
jgi:uncharacterized protein GlcG (DUF336 family)